MDHSKTSKGPIQEIISPTPPQTDITKSIHSTIQTLIQRLAALISLVPKVAKIQRLKRTLP